MTPPTTPYRLGSLIESDLGEPRKRGRQPFWLCPFHEDRNPSLTITPDQQHWKCFGCGRSGDTIAWLMEKHGCSFKDAVQRLGAHSFVTGPLHSVAKRPPQWAKEPRTVDPGWSSRAGLVVRECAKALTDDSAKRARVWLINRGLRLETLSRWQVGFNSTDETRQGLWVERGITIPWFAGDVVTAVNVRRPVGEPKYKMVSGSSRRGLFLGDAIRPGRPTLLVEGEFDALLGWQFLHEMVNVATCGSASDRPDRTAILQLITSPLLLVAYDADAAGRAGADYWRTLTARVHRVPIPAGKDLTEFHQRGGDILVWIRGQLSLAAYTPA